MDDVACVINRDIYQQKACLCSKNIRCISLLCLKNTHGKVKKKIKKSHGCYFMSVQLFKNQQNSDRKIKVAVQPDLNQCILQIIKYPLFTQHLWYNSRHEYARCLSATNEINLSISLYLPTKQNLFPALDHKSENKSLGSYEKCPCL